jgi:Domain of unknown function (DUF4326)
VPDRIQLKRTKGWRLPAGAVNVARPTVWGNPWREGTTGWSILPGGVIDRSGKTLTRQDAVDSYRNSVMADPERVEQVRRELGGKDLACWCKLPAAGEPDICHAAVLLALANGWEVPRLG